VSLPRMTWKLHWEVARAVGLLLIVVCVIFQRRELLHWSEVAFLAISIGLQEAAIRLPSLRRWRSPMIGVYSMLPLVLVLMHVESIAAHSHDLVALALYTPLPLALVSVQIMVLYVRESPRLMSVVLVLALFSTVIGVRRPVDGTLWPWLAVIAVLGAMFLALHYPLLMRTPRRNRPVAVGPARATMLWVSPLLGAGVALLALGLFVMLPRPYFAGDGARVTVIDEDLPGTHVEDGTRGPPGSGVPDTGPGRPPDARPSNVSGLSEDCVLGDFSEIQLNHAPALAVRALYPPEQAPDQLYLRAYTYGEFDGIRWSRLDADNRRRITIEGEVNRRLLEAPVYGGPAWQERRYRIEIGPAGMGEGGALAVPVEAQMINGYAGPLYYDSMEHIVIAPALERTDWVIVDTRELVTSTAAMGRALRDSRPSTVALPDAYWQVPPGLLEDIRERFAYSDDLYNMVWGANEDTRPELRGVYAASRWLAGLFDRATIPGGEYAWEYSLERRPAMGYDSLARFLDTSNFGDERVGHCEYFASAMVVLLRACGVPARLAVGFLARDRDENGRWEVLASDAHAWAEVYLDDFGWVAFDPTPSRGLTRPSAELTENDPEQDDPQDPETPQEEDDADEDDPAIVEGEDDPEAPAAASDWLRDYDRDAQARLFSGMGAALRAFWRRGDELLLGLTGFLPDFLPRSGWLRAGLLALTPLLALLLLLARRGRRKRIERQLLGEAAADTPRRERGLYVQLLMLLARYGFRKRPSETPREFALRVMQRGGEQHLPMLALTDAYYALRYGGARSAEQEFKRKLGEYTEALRDQTRGEQASG
jgi:hypothetical protein